MLHNLIIYSPPKTKGVGGKNETNNLWLEKPMSNNQLATVTSPLTDLQGINLASLWSILLCLGRSNLNKNPPFLAALLSSPTAIDLLLTSPCLALKKKMEKEEMVFGWEGEAQEEAEEEE